MEVYKPGTEVILCDDIKARVTAVSILSEDLIQYKCCWWNGKSRTSEWVRPEEIITTDVKNNTVKIGFRHNA
jgi:uncharacterized protein YodC (DUF2158 family)